MEESKIADNNEHALVPVNFEAQKKQRNQLLKMKAKAMGANTAGEPRILFDIDEQNTFITGGGVPGKKKRMMQ